MKKFEWTDEKIIKDGVSVTRIRALIDIPRHGVKAGDLGGFLEKESSLPSRTESWVADDAVVVGESHIGNTSLVSGNAFVRDSNIFGGVISENACVGGSKFFQNVKIEGQSNIMSSDIDGNITINGTAHVASSILYGEILVEDSAFISESNLFAFKSTITEKSILQKVVAGTIDSPAKGLLVSGEAELNGTHILGSFIELKENCRLAGEIAIYGNAVEISGYAELTGNITLNDHIKVKDLTQITNKETTPLVYAYQIFSGDILVEQ